MTAAIHTGAAVGCVLHEASMSAHVQLHAGTLLTALPASSTSQAAISDLLTAQCDRHSQNILIDSDAKIHLIDNLQALGFDFK